MRILVAVAHADDETLGCFSRLESPSDEVHIFHATDSIPKDIRYAQRNGFETIAEYRAARQQEMEAMLQMAGIPASRYHCLGVADQEAPLHLGAIREFVRGFGADRTYTHAYEGGHPDHDALAAALGGLERVWEFPLYHGRGGTYHGQEFLEGEPELVVKLDEGQRLRKQAWLDCFASQQRVIRKLPLERELFRPMKHYDFSRPPHEGELYYEMRGHGWKWAEWHQATLSAIRV